MFQYLKLEAVESCCYELQFHVLIFHSWLLLADLFACELFLNAGYEWTNDSNVRTCDDQSRGVGPKVVIHILRRNISRSADLQCKSSSVSLHAIHKLNIEQYAFVFLGAMLLF